MSGNGSLAPLIHVVFVLFKPKLSSLLQVHVPLSGTRDPAHSNRISTASWRGPRARAFSK